MGSTKGVLEKREKRQEGSIATKEIRENPQEKNHGTTPVRGEGGRLLGSRGHSGQFCSHINKINASGWAFASGRTGFGGLLRDKRLWVELLIATLGLNRDSFPGGRSGPVHKR